MFQSKDNIKIFFNVIIGLKLFCMQIIVHNLLCVQISARLTHKQKIMKDTKECYYLRLTRYLFKKVKCNVGPLFCSILNFGFSILK